ncbi:MAG: CsiV family protein [Gammaproteobacteria bacterium]
MDKINCSYPAARLCRLVMLFCVMTLASNAEAARWYHVEVIVFKHLSEELQGGEYWTLKERMPNFATAVDLDELRNLDDATSTGSVVPERTLYLAGVYDRLLASSQYKPIMHKAWAQPGYSANNVRRIYLSNGRNRAIRDEEQDVALENDADTFEGTIGLQGGRLLHVGANFVYTSQEATTTISEFRRIKLKQLHYFDHPLFGVLVRVVPYKLDTSE